MTGCRVWWIRLDAELMAVDLRLRRQARAEAAPLDCVAAAEQLVALALPASTDDAVSRQVELGGEANQQVVVTVRCRGAGSTPPPAVQPGGHESVRRSGGGEAESRWSGRRGRWRGVGGGSGTGADGDGGRAGNPGGPGDATREVQPWPGCGWRVWPAGWRWGWRWAGRRRNGRGRPCALQLSERGWHAPEGGALPACEGVELDLGENGGAEGVGLEHNFPDTVRFSSNGLVLDGGTVRGAGSGNGIWFAAWSCPCRWGWCGWVVRGRGDVDRNRHEAVETRRQRERSGGFSLLGLLLSMTIGLTLCGVMIQLLQRDGRLSGTLARRMSERSSQRRTLELLRSEVQRAERCDGGGDRLRTAAWGVEAWRWSWTPCRARSPTRWGGRPVRSGEGGADAMWASLWPARGTQQLGRPEPGVDRWPAGGWPAGGGAGNGLLRLRLRQQVPDGSHDQRIESQLTVAGRGWRAEGCR